MYVSCGKCPACRFEQAMKRVRKINIESEKSGRITLFVTLTYDNHHIPVILRHDVTDDGCIPIYRGVDCSEVIDKIPLSNFPVGTVIDYSHLKTVRGIDLKISRNHPVSVCYFPDVQKFIKRFRFNYDSKNKRPYDGSIFTISEYGALYQRAHFHLLFSFDLSYYERVKDAIIASWSMCSPMRLNRGIEVAKSAAKYVSQYVVKSSLLPPLLQSKPFRQKFSHSRFFGIDENRYGIALLEEALNTRTPEYVVYRNSGGKVTPVSVPIPQHIRNFYVCNIKGKRLLSDESKLLLYCVPQILIYFENSQSTIVDDTYFYDLFNDFPVLRSVFSDFSSYMFACRTLRESLENADYDSSVNFSRSSDFYLSYCHINLRIARYLSARPDSSVLDFAFFQIDFDNLWRSYQLRHLHDDAMHIPLLERYDNISLAPHLLNSGFDYVPNPVEIKSPQFFRSRIEKFVNHSIFAKSHIDQELLSDYLIDMTIEY